MNDSTAVQGLPSSPGNPGGLRRTKGTHILARQSSTLLCVNNYHYARGGAEMVYLNQIGLFRRHAWDVVPFAMHHPDNFADEYDRYFIDELEFGSGYNLLETLRRVPKVVYSFESRSKLGRLIDDVRPDVAHLHNIYHHISPSILSVLKDRGVPTFLTLHDFKIACPAYKMLTHDGVCERCRGGNQRHLIANRCVKNSMALSGLVYLEAKLHDALGSYRHKVDRLIAPSRFMRDKMIEWGVNAEQLAYIPNAIPDKPYEPPADPGKHFIYIGRLGPEKGVATLIRAGAEARVPLVIVGTGPEEEMLKDLARQSGADVEFTGYLMQDAAMQQLRDARGLVLPSEWYENAPISILEAYREGIPVIGAEIGGITEMVQHGVTGYTFESGSVPGLAGCLSEAASMSDSQVRSMGDAGRTLFETEYSEKPYYDRLSRLYAGFGVQAPCNSSD